ncbi:hypothetical protein CPB83DRAFT_884172 [Crepidotus variabilis]|uniref:PH domain-containing protein n=1 Tax=Crepidotus variabilis TaxID=179855 RepID=A0A9P6EEP7_9AGAR|nr:hypothetical protein CPB83DRAFT_884172 [Crepidotus variabilis]
MSAGDGDHKALSSQTEEVGRSASSRGFWTSKNPNPVSTGMDGRSRSNSRANEKQFGYSPISRATQGDDFASNAPNTNNLHGRSKFRGSILVAASDALGFKLGRRRPSIRQPPSPIILPDVIEITASRAEEEAEERSRLREAAAQAIGLQSYRAAPKTHSRDDSATDEDDEEHSNSQHNRDLHRHTHAQQNSSSQEGSDMRRLAFSRNSDSSANISGRSPHGSNLSITIPSHSQFSPPPPTPPLSPPPLSVISQQPSTAPSSTRVSNRFRSGSMITHSPSNSTTIAPIPQYPSTVSSLSSFKQCAGTYLKYYPPSSLRIFALSKTWKYRYLILSSPATLVTRGQGPAVSYLHLFKSASPDEKELERMEINEDSVVFMAEEEVGGKRAVIKVGGVDAGAMRKEYMIEEGGHTMWLLQISDPADSHKWITNIKNAILGQRTVRAGLIPALTLGGNEPRGDMDVMLSIRTQGIAASPPNRWSSASPPFNEHSQYAPSISSQSARSTNAATRAPGSPTSTVSALKGLFTGNRSRAASRAASINSERQHDRETAGEESFASIGSNLLNMLRSNTPDNQSINTIQTVPVPRTLPIGGPVVPIQRRLEQKIVENPGQAQWTSNFEPSTSTRSEGRANKALSTGALSLQPPPRKRWTSVGPSTTSAHTQHPKAETSNTLTVPEPSSRKSSMSMSRMSSETGRSDHEHGNPPISPSLSAFPFGTPEQRPRAPSLQSVSTYASADNGPAVERSSSSTKRSSGTGRGSGRRWSRQGNLPTRLTPPTEPPPAVPGEQSFDRPPSPGSSKNSQRSVISALPTFAKRASQAESVHSINSISSSPPPPISPLGGGGSLASRNRFSVPPPRPAPTSALPPAPSPTSEDCQQDVLKPLEPVSTASKASFRLSSSHRSNRMSLTAPKPPPNTNLPPRPDESDFGPRHRRISTGSGRASLHSQNMSPLESIPASPTPSPKAPNPLPPPSGPLPPRPPPHGPLPAPPSDPPPKRTTSLKQRFRMLSTGSSSSNVPALSRLSIARSSNERSSTDSSSVVIAPPFMPTNSMPATPIAEKILQFQDDSFLQMYTPVMPMHTPASIHGLPLPQDSEFSEVTSLSPPPRRGSKQIQESELPPPPPALNFQKSMLPQIEDDDHSDAEDTNSNNPSKIAAELKPFSLSAPGSPLSPRSQHSQNFREASELDSPIGEDLPLDDIDSPIHEEKPSLSSLSSQHRITLSRSGSVISLGIMSL